MKRRINSLLLILFGVLSLPFLGVALSIPWTITLKLFFINLILQLLALLAIIYGFTIEKDRNVQILYSLYLIGIIIFFTAAVFVAGAGTDINIH